jgi:hypothetical protein
MKLIAMLVIFFMLVLFFGCRTDTTIEYYEPDGIHSLEDRVKTKTVKDGFNMGFSEGDNKVLDILDVNVSGIGK